MFAERAQQIKSKVAALIQTYEAKHPGQKVPNIQIRFDLRGRAAGIAGRRGWDYFMRFNRDMMLNDSWDHLINDTVPHELAHIICFANGSDRGHGWAWRGTCRELGGSGETYHKEAVTYAKGRTYVYTTTTGRVVHISETKHRRIQNGVSYSGRNGFGRLDRACSYSLLGSDQVIKPQTKEVPVETIMPKPQVIPQAKTGSNAVLIRARIAQAKARGESANVVVQFGVEVLGMKAALAKTYVKNNWDRA